MFPQLQRSKRVITVSGIKESNTFNIIKAGGDVELVIPHPPWTHWFVTEPDNGPLEAGVLKLRSMGR